MTDKVTADNVYLKPLTKASIKEILEKHNYNRPLGEKYVYDQMHPTPIAQALIAKEITRKINNIGIFV